MNKFSLPFKGLLFPCFMAFNISAATLLLQLVHTRIFSVVFWYHFVYSIISIVLMGFGVSGTWLTIGENSFLGRHLDIRKTALLFVLTTIFSILIVPELSVSIGTLMGSGKQIGQFLLIYVVSIFPYFFAGWILGILFRDFRKDIHVLYFSDLLGAGLGCFIYLAGMQVVGPVALIFICCLMVGFPTVWWNTTKQMRMIYTFSILGIVVAAFAYSEIFGINFTPERMKAFRFEYENLADDDQQIVEFSKWNEISRIDVVSTKKNPQSKRIFIDGEAWSGMMINVPDPVEPFDSEKELLSINRSPYFFHKNPENVLVIGPGGGTDIVNALRGGAQNIYAAELNPTTWRLMQNEYGQATNHLYNRSQVHVFNEEGRSFVSRNKTKYDVIMSHATDTHTASAAGAYVLSENYLYTVEGIASYLEHLKPGGTLAISRFYSGDGIRLFITAVEAMYYRGIKHPEKNILALSKDWMTLLIRNEPFSSEEVSNLRKHITQHGKADGHTFLFPPENNQYQLWVQPHIMTFMKARAMGEQDAFYDLFPLNVRPTTDDSPFYFQSHKWKDFFSISDKNGPYQNWAPFILVLLLIFAAAVVGLFIVLPLVFSKNTFVRIQKGSLGYWVFYFFCLGYAYIFIEIALMQRFSLLLGHPSRSIALVLATLLISSGVGAFVSKSVKNSFQFVMLILVMTILAAVYVYPLIVQWALPFPLWARAMTTILLITPLGICMGMPFPIGIENLSSYDKTFVSWMWGINGGTTVLGSILAIILAMHGSFSLVLTMGALGYSMALICYRKISTMTMS